MAPDLTPRAFETALAQTKIPITYPVKSVYAKIQEILASLGAALRKRAGKDFSLAAFSARLQPKHGHRDAASPETPPRQRPWRYAARHRSRCL